MQTRNKQTLVVSVLLVAGLACNKSEPEHERAAADVSGDETAEAHVESENDAQERDEHASVPPHQREPERSAQRERAQRESSDESEAKVDDTVASDNTGRNKRDQEGETLTPVDQGESERDVEITRRIREAMVGNDSLSFMAKNAKIITRDGRVTLRGPVHSEDERKLIEAAARSVAGPTQVVSQLEVK